MEFPEYYFEDEVREGFYISGMIKRCWAAQLEVLQVIAEICKKHQIRWFADCGTLLGAVRHKGYIPWDDDLDICMLRDEFIRFKQIVKQELPEGWVLLSNERDDWTEHFIRVNNGMHIEYSPDYLEQFHDFPFSAGVDIFPLDYLAKNKEDEELRWELTAQVKGIFEIMNDENQHMQECQDAATMIEEVCGVSFDRNKSLKQQLAVLLDNLYSLYTADESDEVALLPFWIDERNHVYKKKYFDKAIMMPFENIEIPVPLEYDHVLKIEYGENYMKLVQKGGMHDYPHFKKQEEIAIRNLGHYPLIYKFSKEHLYKEISEKPNRERKEVLFIPYKASMWDSLEDIWKAAAEDPACDVYIMPIPYYDRNGQGVLVKEHYEGDKFPSYVPITHYNSYNIEVHRPDIIFTQNPYDECNYTTTVHSVFYSSNLKRFTEKLIYIPGFVLNEFNSSDEKAIASMQFFVTVPGVVHADKVIVQSENMRERYIEVLTDFAGEDTREVWEKKILGLETPKKEKPILIDKGQIEMPVEWKKIIQKSDGGFKKVFLYHTSVAGLVQSEDKMLDKIQTVLQTFKEYREEAALLWSPDELTQDALEKANPHLWEMYQKIVEEYKNESWGIFDDTKDLDRAVMLSDAYYGDSSSIVQHFRKAEKPIMLQNVWM